MTPLSLTLRARPGHAVDVSTLTPERLRGRDAEAIARMRLRCGRRSVAAGELFEIAGEDAMHLRFLRASERLAGIGRGLREGTIEVRGRAGDWAGLEMAGGTLRIRGDAGDYAGAEMHGGELTVTGDAGDFLGGARAGEQQGMRGGRIQVHGNAGARVGDRMRRGLIIIEGDAGDYCGSRMLAGTIMVLGESGRMAGTGMRRGTIVLAREPKAISATFNSCGPMKMEMLRLLFRQLSRSNRRMKALADAGPLAERYAGDLALGGKGELLIMRAE